MATLPVQNLPAVVLPQVNINRGFPAVFGLTYQPVKPLPQNGTGGGGGPVGTPIDSG